MKKKLTLHVDAKVAERAKKYVRKNNSSISRMVESYLERLTDENPTGTPPEGSIVSQLSGIVEFPNDFDEKREIVEYLNKKYE